MTNARGVARMGCAALDSRRSCRSIRYRGNGLVTNIVSFNGGVEIGQFLSLTAVLLALGYWRTRPATASRTWSPWPYGSSRPRPPNSTERVYIFPQGGVDQGEAPRPPPPHSVGATGSLRIVNRESAWTTGKDSVRVRLTT
jgi:hypothetical protein